MRIFTLIIHYRVVNNVEQLLIVTNEVLSSLTETQYGIQVQLGYLLKNLSTGEITSFFAS